MNIPALPWPLCLDCRKEYIPVPTIRGCPWCDATAKPIRRHYDHHTQHEYDSCPHCGHGDYWNGWNWQNQTEGKPWRKLLDFDTAATVARVESNQGSVSAGTDRVESDVLR